VIGAVPRLDRTLITEVISVADKSEGGRPETTG
jgi:hypothetical protein